MKKYIFLLVLPVLFPIILLSQKMANRIIDVNATKETKALYYNLYTLSKKHILFGHQHATEYGHGWSGEENRSDVKSVTGSHPAVIGVDFSGLSGRSVSDIEKEKKLIKKEY
ncbi:MAG: glycosyl hydrolase [Bacteroidota bacterium]